MGYRMSIEAESDRSYSVGDDHKLYGYVENYMIEMCNKQGNKILYWC